MKLDDFAVGDQLGEGSFGTVATCVQKETGRRFALKTIVIAQVERQRHGLQQVMTEKKALILLATPSAHPSFIQLHGTFKDSDHLYLLLEYCAGGELFGQIKRLGSCHVSCARWLTAELIHALDYMHSKRVLHRDLKPENILLDDVGHIKLIDFGSARLLDSTEGYDSFVGTAEYVSPEVLRDEEASEASDYWALGCILYQMLTGSPPFQGDSQYLTFEKIKALDFSRSEALDEMSEAARSLVLGLLHPTPSERLGARVDDGSGGGSGGGGSGGGGSGGVLAIFEAHPFFAESVPPIDFAAVTKLPPPPLKPPPPMPSIEGDSVLNAELAHRLKLLSPEDRTALANAQRHVRWSAFLDQIGRAHV